MLRDLELSYAQHSLKVATITITKFESCKFVLHLPDHNLNIHFEMEKVSRGINIFKIIG